jgi:hypothetical protein
MTTSTKTTKKKLRPIERMTPKQVDQILQIESADTLAWSTPTVDRNKR